MEFKKYQHVSRLGVSGTDGILNGECFIFPKIDGTNSQVYLNKIKEIKVELFV